MFCSRCGTQVETSQRFCPNCGQDLSAITNVGQGATARMAAPPEDEASIVREALKEEYDLEKELGRGGMAIVFKARDKQLEREVAIKVLPFSLSFDAEFVERFQREARTAGKLEHPNIIPIYRVGRAGRVIYFVMKFIRGKSLSDVIQTRGALPIPEIRRLLIECVRALGYAHKHGIVHRDIKPDNIMFDELGQAIVTDFGIAKAQSGAKLTGTGMSIGTPHYMSPEQARAQNLDGRSDLYSLGVVAYQCLTGRVPFDGEDSFSIGYKHIMEELPVPELETQDQRDLFGVVQRMMAKKPDERFQSADELIISLEGGVATSPADMATMQTLAIERPTLKAPGAAVPAQPTTPLPRASASMGKPPEAAPAQAASGKPAKPKRPPRPPREEKSGSKLPLAIAAVLGIALLGVGGYYFGVMRPAALAEEARLSEQQRLAALRRLELATVPALRAVSGQALGTVPAVLVRDGNGRPVAGDTVRVVVTGDSVEVANALAVTDSQGRAEFDGLALSGPAGSYPLRIQLDTATLVTPEIVLTAAATRESRTPDTTRPPPASRDSGTISIAFQGTAPPNPRVTLNGQPQRAMRVKVPVGQHNLRIEADGFQVYTNRVTVRNNQVSSVDVTMRAAAARDTTTRTAGGTPSPRCASDPSYSIANQRNECYDRRPSTRVAPRLTPPSTCTGNITPVTLMVNVSASGEVVGSPSVLRNSSCREFGSSAQAWVADLTFVAATKGGQPVAAWMQLQVQPIRP
jgi:serine/threonine protein kinase